MSKLIAIATLLFSHITAAVALVIPITHPLPLHHTLNAPTLTAIELQGPAIKGAEDDAKRVFATRDEPSSGISGGAIGGIIGMVVIVIILIGFFIAKSRRSTNSTTQGGFIPRPLKSHFAHPHGYGNPFISPPPAYNHPLQLQQQQQLYPIPNPVQMPQTVHLGQRGAFYAPSVQHEEERGVRFGPVGVRRYGG